VQLTPIGLIAFSQYSIRDDIVKKPEDYCWNNIGCLQQTIKKDNLLALEFRLFNEEKLSALKRIQYNRQFVKKSSVLPTQKGESIGNKHLENNRKKHLIYCFIPT
jgi:hypothetical protein